MRLPPILSPTRQLTPFAHEWQWHECVVGGKRIPYCAAIRWLAFQWLTVINSTVSLLPIPLINICTHSSNKRKIKRILRKDASSWPRPRMRYAASNNTNISTRHSKLVNWCFVQFLIRYIMPFYEYFHSEWCTTPDSNVAKRFWRFAMTTTAWEQESQESIWM